MRERGDREDGIETGKRGEKMRERGVERMGLRQGKEGKMRERVKKR